MLFARTCLAFVLACSFSIPAVALDSFTKDHRIVIVVGLPGDLESEKAFSSETGKLLSILNSPAMMPSGVLLLSNLGDLPDFKPSYPLEKMANDRATFLGLSAKLKTEAKSPVFIVFGHGGTQGTTAVFHVPGPRLTPADFSSVADVCPGSTWLLFFPGSGAFARSIQAARRSILATEADQVFTQDPISFELLLDLLNKEPDLNRLGPLLGDATDHWYTSRSLARTEEPAMWLEGQAPKKMIGSTLATDPAMTATPLAVTPSTGGSSQDDDAWKKIQPADARDYPKSDAVILSRRVSFVIDDASQISEEDEVFLQILTREGKRFGDFDYSFSSQNEDLTFSACEVRRADGQIEQLDPDSIHDATGNAPEGYDATNKKIFSLPHAEPGSILHVRVRHTWKHFALPHAFEEIPLNDEIPIANLKVEISVPDKSAFHFKFCRQAAVDPVITQSHYGSDYTWQFQNIPATPQEPLSASDGKPVLAISTFPDWAGFADWYRRLIRESDNITPEIEAQARDLTKDAKTDQEKIAAVTQFVTNFRYVSIPLGVNSFRPHAAANILKDRYGDCKDKANLLNTLLKSLGYDTSLVLVPRFAQAYEDLPGFAFNHAISHVQLNGQALWIDSTDDVCRIGLLPPGDPGRKVLVVNDHANTLTELPKPVAHDHQLSLQTTVDFPQEGNREADVQVTAQTTGYADYLVRALAKAWNSQGRIAPLLSGAFYPTSGLFEARHQDASDMSALEQTMSWKADGNWSGLLSQLPQSSTRMLRLPCWLPKEWPLGLMPRTTALHLNEGYPMEISETCVIHLPAVARNLKLPDSVKEDGSVLSWQLSWTQSSPSEVDAHLQIALLKADLDLADIPQFQASCRHLQDSLQDGFSFQNE